jgi:hypothetical protein
MYRRLSAALILTSLIGFEGCSDPVPTVPNNAPPPSGTPAPVAPGVIKRPGKGPARPSPTTPNAV